MIQPNSVGRLPTEDGAVTVARALEELRTIHEASAAAEK
jgi:hypothetical protein